ncbi:MAG TPA: AAA family ATPase [Vicinamibacterales bacterium]
MIFVDRARIAAPDVLTSDKVLASYDALRRFFGTEASPDAQRQPPFNRALYAHSDVREALKELFHGKCGYCETPLTGTVPLDVDQLRPKQRALNADGATSPEAYWWLAYEWSNLYPTCGNCNRMKGSRFPVEGQRAAAETRGDALAAEKPLLLDPCIDDPDTQLVFSQDGQVASSMPRGRVTIDILGLNRESLVDGRKRAIEELRSDLEAIKRKSRGKALPQQRLLKLVDETTPFSAARKQALREWLLKEQQQVTFVKSAAPASEPERAATVAHFKQAEQVQEAYSIADEAAKAHYYARTRVIDRIEIKNFRAIEDLTLRFSEQNAESLAQQDLQGTTSTPWLMLLGENGSGKSSVLQAAALTLIGEKWRNKLDLDARRYVRRGERDGTVRVYLTGSSTPIELRFSTTSDKFESEPKEPKVLLIGYGSTRLLPRGKVKSPQQYDFARIDNLFDPFEPLNDANAWLGDLDPAQFDTVARALRPILQLGPDDRLIQEKKGVEAEIFGARVTLEELSDGYQSVVALATDIMRVMLKRWDAMEVAEGIVVLDEVGSHLHPRWRMRIVDAMRRAFPRLQFLASTHDPLCLRGLTSGEVTVMRRDAVNRVIAITDLPPLAGLRVDQLLTSEYFGLNSTIDPAVDNLFEEYYKLLALRQRDTAQEARLAQLKGELDAYRVLGANKRDRMMLEAIDAYLAEERAGTDGRPTLEATKKKLVEIWKTTPATASPAGRTGA